MNLILLTGIWLALVQSPTLECGNRLQASVNTVNPTQLNTILAASVDSDSSSSFNHMLLTIIAVESAFQEDAVSPTGNVGLMQLGALAVADAVTACGPAASPLSGKPLTDPEVNVYYGSCYLRMLKQQAGSWPATLAAYHGGYAQLIKLRDGKPIHPDTAQYVTKVLYLYNEVCNVESNRQARPTLPDRAKVD